MKMTNNIKLVLNINVNERVKIAISALAEMKELFDLALQHIFPAGIAIAIGHQPK